jgi:hypothetical protein
VRELVLRHLSDGLASHLASSTDSGFDFYSAVHYSTVQYSTVLYSNAKYIFYYFSYVVIIIIASIVIGVLQNRMEHMIPRCLLLEKRGCTRREGSE